MRQDCFKLSPILVMLSLFPSLVLPQVPVPEGSYTVCQNFKGTFIPRSGLEVDRVVGMPGKRGPKGEKGSLGSIEESEIVHNLAAELEAIKACSGLLRGGICYFLHEEKVDHQNAVKECQSRGGQLASVDSMQLYGALLSYTHDVFVVLQSATYIQVWTDGIYEGGEVILRNDVSAPFLKWYPGYPRSGQTEKYMAFEIKKESGSTHQHMFNIHGNHVAYPLCQRP